MQRLFFGPDLYGFLTLHSRDEAGYIGTVLITDAKGVPREFRYTYPIRPNPVQHSLYGVTLHRHVGIELIGRPLIRSVQNKPRLLFVDQPFLLELAGHSHCPVLCVSGQDANGTVGLDPTGSADCGEEVHPTTNAARSLQIVQTKGVQPRTRQLVEQLHARFDVLEPFDRMREAVATIFR